MRKGSRTLLGLLPQLTKERLSSSRQWRESCGAFRNLNAESLANIIWAFATAYRRAPPPFEAVAEKAKGSLEDFKPQGLAKFVWAFAKVSQRAPQVLEVVAKNAEERSEDFNHKTSRILFGLLPLSTRERLSSSRH